jgi:hypothetical protein
MNIIRWWRVFLSVASTVRLAGWALSGSDWSHTPHLYIEKLTVVSDNFAIYFRTRHNKIINLLQGCGSGLDPNSVTLLDPDPYWKSGSGSRGKKIKKFQLKNAIFSYFFFKNFTNKKIPGTGIPVTTFWKFFWWIRNTNIFDLIWLKFRF